MIIYKKMIINYNKNILLFDNNYSVLLNFINF